MTDLAMTQIQKPLRLLVSAGLVLALATLLSACRIRPDPITSEESSTRVNEFKEMLAAQPAAEAPISLQDAMARALRYNLSTRIKEVESQIAENRLDASMWSMLPKLTGSVGRTARDHSQASSSSSVTTGEQSLETSTSTDRVHDDASLKVSWNVLDFGVSYFSARQAANQTLVAKERRKKVIQQLINDVRDAYWRAVSAERLLSQIDNTLNKVSIALVKAQSIERDRTRKPVEILNYQRDLYGKLLQLQGLRRTLVASKYELAKMMNIPPSTPFKVVVPDDLPELPSLAVGVAELEDQALLRRAELVEQTLQERIARDEIHKSIARMFPGLELSGDRGYSSNSYLLYNQWSEFSLKMTWNLMNIVSGWDDISQAEMQRDLVIITRQSLGMAVIGQVDLAHMDYSEALEAFQTAKRIEEINRKIEFHSKNESEALNMGDLDIIQIQLNTLLSQMKKDEQYALLQNALGRLAVSTGEYPFDGLDDGEAIDKLSGEIGTREGNWLKSAWFKPMPGPGAATATSAATRTPANAAPVSILPSAAAASGASPAGAGAREVQFAAYRQEKQAAQLVDRLKAAHADLFAPLTTAIQPATVNGATFYRVRATGLASLEAASALCAQFRIRSVDCMVVR